MLKPYESDTCLVREISVEAHLLNCNTDRIIKDKVWDRMKTVCSGDFGFVLRLNSIDSIEMGVIDTDTGTVIYRVQFTVTSFKPNVEDILISRITAVSKSGFFAQLGPLEIFVPCTHIPSTYEYLCVDGISSFNSEYTTIKKDEYVRIKICAIQKMDIDQIFESLSITDRPKTPYIGGVLEAIGELIDE